MNPICLSLLRREQNDFFYDLSLLINMEPNLVEASNGENLCEIREFYFKMALGATIG